MAGDLQMDVTHADNVSSHSSAETRIGEKRPESGGEQRINGKRILQEKDCYDCLGYSFSTWKKWRIIFVIFMAQVSTNFVAAIFPNAVSGISERYGVSAQAARVGATLFLCMYGLASEAFAGLSEEYGRWPVLQGSLFLVNVWQIPAALSPTFAGVLIARFLAGSSAAVGSVTLGVVADMWEPEDQQYAVNFVVLASVGASSLGPVIGGFIEQYLDYRWVFWVMLIVGGFVQVLHLVMVPETRSTILVDREAKRRRESGEDPDVWGPNEARGNFLERWSWREFGTTFARPFILFVTEPIVLFLSLLSGFSDSLIYVFLESYGPVFTGGWGFTTSQVGLCFCTFLVAYGLTYLILTPDIMQQRKQMRAGTASPERRLWILLWLVPLLPIGLFIFAWTSRGPQYNSVWVPIVAPLLIGIANYVIYATTVDYMVAAYGPYGSSATGGNALARDFMAGVLTLAATPFYTNLPWGNPIAWPSTVLGIIAIFICIPPFVFYFYGEWFRSRSKFACALEETRKSSGRPNHRITEAPRDKLPGAAFAKPKHAGEEEARIERQH